MRYGQLVRLHPLARVEDLSDDGLAAACATGDRAAQSLLFERHADAVYRFIARMESSSDAVDDLVQATFLAAFRSAGQFRGPRLRGWLLGIAANTLRTHVRKEMARRRVVNALVDEPAPTTAEPRDVDVVKLRDAIAALPPKLREALVLVDLEGERGGDAAAALGVPEGTLWRRLSEARAKLRDVLSVHERGAP
jgi:RNA polymerase sigma factor (sigma-70 family)